MKIPMMAIAASTLALPAAPALAAELPAESRTSTIAASPFSATPASAHQYQRRDYRDRREYRRGYRDARREARQALFVEERDGRIRSHDAHVQPQVELASAGHEQGLPDVPAHGETSAVLGRGGRLAPAGGSRL